MFRVSFCCDVCIPALCKRHLEVQYQYLSFSRLRPKPHSPLLIFLLACATGSADRKPFAWSGRLISNFLVLKEDNQFVILPPYFLHTSSILPPSHVHTSFMWHGIEAFLSFSIQARPRFITVMSAIREGLNFFFALYIWIAILLLNEVTTSSWSLDCM